MTDNESARECISENRILRRIARHCIEPTNGLFITLPEDDGMAANLYRRLSAGWHRGHAALAEGSAAPGPAVNPTLLGAVQVPDGTIDPFRLTAANMLDAREHGAQILPAAK